MRKLLSKGMWLVLGVAGLVVASSTVARADETVIASVPFDFTVNGVHMPAGRYVVTELSGQTTASVTSEDRRHFAFVLTNALDPIDAGMTSELVFERVGTTSYLTRIVGGEGMGREIPLPAKVLKGEHTRVAVAAFPSGAKSATH